MILQIASYFGYLASLFLIIALLVNGDIKFRWFNILGNISFIIYGIVFIAWPVLLTNGILITINIYYLYKLYVRIEDFDLIEFSGEEKLATKFLGFYDNDIKSYFPQFSLLQLKGNLNFVVLRDIVIANIFSAQILNNGDAVVSINYTLKKYRDYKVGRFIFKKEKYFLLSKGVKRIVYNDVTNKNHVKYLLNLGFEKEGERYIKTL
ncbi:MAG: hypothetical protein LH615_06070 [Ferruginibacter sp.]|nr:hypothetical protein [Ferruginibacter sp.]